MNLGEAIKTLRVKDVSTQKEFAKSANITQSYLCLIEKGHKKPSLDVLERIAEAMNIPLPVLFWFSIEKKDVGAEKQDAYDQLKTVVDNMIHTYFGKDTN